VLTLEADSIHLVKWFVDASFGVHGDVRSHTGAYMTLGKGCVYSASNKQKLNSKSSTEAELIGVALMAQGYTALESVMYQDNQSAMLLEENGRGSSSKRTRHINVRYFFVTDRVRRREVRVEYCPTQEMIADFFTKPLQGSKFLEFRSWILNLSE
jgi:KUP system potassium uptake protein